MIRTQIYLPSEMHQELKLLAQQKKENFSQLIRQGIELLLEKKAVKKREKVFGEGFFGAGGTKGPKNLASKIDYYLYGEGSEWGSKK